MKLSSSQMVTNIRINDIHYFIIKNYDFMDKKELIMHLFIGKVADIIGIEETTRLLEEANEAFE